MVYAAMPRFFRVLEADRDGTIFAILPGNMTVQPDNVSRSAASDVTPVRDARAVAILAKTIFRELKQSGLSEEDIMGVASELLAQVASGLRARPR